MPLANYGALIMWANTCPGTIPSTKNPKPDPHTKCGELEFVGTDHTFSNDSDSEATLFFIVNDLVLNGSDTAKNAFLLDKDQLNKRLKETHYGLGTVTDEVMQKEFINQSNYWENELKNNPNLWDIWYADNLGGFTITIGPMEQSK